MCGIVGFSWNNETLINHLLKQMKHRGPDDMGVFCNDEISLGQNRLSILDLSVAGHQPMFYHKSEGAYSNVFRSKDTNDFRYAIVYNGEIYNFIELKHQLILKGYVFTTNCDTELVLASYIEWGEDCLTKFDGMWAFAIYDKFEKQLFLARDRTGEKPLYILDSENSFAFSSELKSLRPLLDNKEIDQKWLRDYLLFGFTSTQNTCIQGIKQLNAGHFMIHDLKNKKTTKPTKYWTNNFDNIDIPFEEAKKTLRTLVSESVKSRLISDVPVGAFLSGGVDSSIIVSEMRKHVQDLKTFSIGFDFKEYNESNWANIVAKKFKTDHFDIQFTSKNVKEAIDNLSYFFDEPFGDSSMAPTYLVAKVAKEHVSVCLSGTGADELFGGYDRFIESKQLSYLIKLPNFTKKIVQLAYSKLTKNKDKAHKLGELLKSTNQFELYIKLFSDLFRTKDDSVIDFNELSDLRNLMSEHDHLSSMLNFEQQIYLTNDLLVKEDRACMANSLEGRIPFLDPKIINFANSLPSKYKIHKGVSKYILKKAYEDTIPYENLYRQKKGFGMPLREYLRGDLKQYAAEIIFDRSGHSFYDNNLMLKFWDQHQKGESDYSSFFWKVIMFNKWQKQWM